MRSLSQDALWAQLRGLLGQMNNLLYWERHEAKTETRRYFSQVLGDERNRKYFEEVRLELLLLVQDEGRVLTPYDVEQFGLVWLDILQNKVSA